jgi:hypothetical protein
MVITVPILKIDVLNRNDRIYTQQSVDLMMLDFIRKQDRFYGQLGFPDDCEVHVQEISHRVEKLYRKDNVLFGKILILDTVNGKILKESLDQYVFRTRCIGNTYNNKIVSIKNFIAIDAVPMSEDPYGEVFHGDNTGKNYGI